MEVPRSLQDFLGSGADDAAPCILTTFDGPVRTRSGGTRPVSQREDDDGAAPADEAANQEDEAPLLRVGAVVDAAAVAFGETYVKQARNGGPKSFRGTIVAASVEDDHWNVKYDEDGEVFATEAQHLTLVSAPSDDDAPARRAKKRAAAATPKKAKKARKILVEC